MDTPTAQDTAKRVDALAREAARRIREELGPETRVIWFGSWVRGSARPHSDIDLAIGPETAPSTEALARIQERIEAIPTLYLFDLVVMSEAASAIREAIEREGVEL